MTPANPLGTNESIVSDAVILERWDRGEKASDIARAFGLTRQRVDQRLKRNGRSGPNRNGLPRADALVAAARSAFAMDELAATVAQTSGALGTALDRYGIRVAVNQILQANRQERFAVARRAAQQPVVARLRNLAVRFGHTPTIHELEPEGIFHAGLAQMFGSAAVAMRAAGLVPNQPGQPPAPLPEGFGDDTTATLDNEELLERADRLLRNSSTDDDPVPSGNTAPATRTVESVAYFRDPSVVAWVRRNARGACEACGAPGYETDAGSYFLEVHHVVPLADGGPDVVTNAVAVCETCHGKLHRWVHRTRMLEELRGNVARLSTSAA